MALDLLKREDVWEADLGCGVEASYLVARLCEEAKVCLTYTENRVEMAAATFDVNRGLLVTDRDGKVWRLRVSAEEYSPPMFKEAQDKCPHCNHGSYEAWPDGQGMTVRCATCEFEWWEPLG